MNTSDQTWCDTIRRTEVTEPNIAARRCQSPPSGPTHRKPGGRGVRFWVKQTRFLAAVVVAAAAIATVGAHAASASQCNRGGCDLFAFGPANGYFFSTPGGATVGMICWTDSSWYAGTNRWFYISTIFGNGRAWVSANQVMYQIAVRHC